MNESIHQERKKLSEEMCERLEVVEDELSKGLGLVSGIEKSVTFFGSTRFRENNVHYKQAERLAGALAQKGYTIITGGGPGIMEAANKGAYSVGGRSIGFNIALPNEQSANEYLTDMVTFSHFFTRKVALSFAAEAYLYFPGGYGTLDEFFEIITLVQTRKMARVPIVLVGRDYWRHLDNFISTELFQDHGSIDEEDMNLYHVTDDEDEIISIVESAPVTQLD